jgi:hypothetical protein
VVLLNRHLIGTSPDKGLDASLVFLNEWILQIGGLQVGCLVWASIKFLFLFSYPRVHVISHSFQIYCFTKNIEAKSILWHPSFGYLLCIVGIGSGSEVGDYFQKNKLFDCRNLTWLQESDSF